MSNMALAMVGYLCIIREAKFSGMAAMDISHCGTSTIQDINEVTRNTAR